MGTKNATFSVSDVDPTALVAATAPAKPARRRIFIEEGYDPSDPQYVDIGVNGIINRYRRGVEVEMPVDYVHVLQNAIADKTVQTEDQGIITRPVRRFPFQDRGPVSASES